MEIVLGIILLIAAVFLVVSVLMQDGKDHRLSGTIAGGAETFFGKNKGSTIDKMLSKVTSIVAIVFCLIVVAMYVFQPTTDLSSVITPSTVDTSAVAADTDAADTADGAADDGASDDAASETAAE